MGQPLEFCASGLAVILPSDTSTLILILYTVMIQRSIPHSPEALSMRATAHTLCRWYLPTMSMLVYHAVDDWTTGSSSAEVCRFAQKHPSGMTWSTPERCETEVLLTVFSAVEVGGLGRVATAHQIAPWSEDLTCLSHHAVGAAFRSTSVGGFARSQSDMGIAQRRKSNTGPAPIRCHIVW